MAKKKTDAIAAQPASRPYLDGEMHALYNQSAEDIQLNQAAARQFTSPPPSVGEPVIQQSEADAAFNRGTSEGATVAARPPADHPSRALAAQPTSDLGPRDPRSAHRREK